MKKTSLYSLAALMAAVCLPAGSMIRPVLASNSTLPAVIEGETVDPACITPDEFVNRFCKFETIRLLPDGSSVKDSVWYTTLTPENAPLLAQGKGIFDQMDAQRQQIVIQAAAAFGIDYRALAQSAVDYCAALENAAQTPQTPAPAAPSADLDASSQTKSDPAQSAADSSASSEKKDEQPYGTNETSASDSSAPTKADPSQEAPANGEDVKSSEDTGTSNEQTPSQTPDSKTEQPVNGENGNAQTSDAQENSNVSDEETSDKPADDTDPAKPEDAAPEAPAEVVETKPVSYQYTEGTLNLSSSHMPGGMSVQTLSFPVNPETDDLTGTIAKSLAENAGWPAWTVEPVIYQYTNKEVTVQTAVLYRVAAGDLQMLFDYGIGLDGHIAVTLYNASSCSYNMDSSTLQLPRIGYAVLNPIAETDGIQNEIQPVDPAAAPANTAEATGIKTESVWTVDKAASSENSEEAGKVAQLSVFPEIADETIAKQRAALINAPTLMSLDNQANDFVQRYAMQNGAVIKAINASNYQQVLNGMKAWNALSTSQRRSVNDYLIANGSSRFQQLYRQANEYRLGMPLQKENLPSSAGSVNTASVAELPMYLASFAGAASALVTFSQAAFGKTNKDEDDASL